MDPSEFADLQEGLLFVYLPLLHWWLVLLAAGGFAAAIGIFWLAMLQWMSRER